MALIIDCTHLEGVFPVPGSCDGNMRVILDGYRRTVKALLLDSLEPQSGVPRDDNIGTTLYNCADIVRELNRD